MNNQAAQTMPELPEPWTIRYHDDATGREIGPPTPLYTADQMHQYARDYAAMLAAAPAASGVDTSTADGWKLVPVEPTEEFRRIFGFMGLSGFSACYAEMLTAAQSAPSPSAALQAGEK